jgi:hypothetical protein
MSKEIKVIEGLMEKANTLLNDDKVQSFKITLDWQALGDKLDYYVVKPRFNVEVQKREI